MEHPYVSDSVTSAAIEKFVSVVFLPGNFPLEGGEELFAQYNSLEGARALVDMLSPQKAQIVSLHYGLYGGEPLGRTVTGRHPSVMRSRTTVERHRARAIVMLRHQAVRLHAEAQAAASGVTSIRVLPLRESTTNILIRGRINTVEELHGKTADDLLSITSFQPHRLQEVRAVLAERGEYLKGEGPPGVEKLDKQ